MKFLIYSCVFIFIVPALFAEELSDINTRSVQEKQAFLELNDSEWRIVTYDQSFSAPVLSSSTILSCEGNILEMPLDNELSGYPIVIIRIINDKSQEGGIYVHKAQIACN